MAHSSTVQILKITNETRVSQKTKEPYDVREAEVLLLDDAGAVEVAGTMRLTKTLVEGLTLGTYRAGFTMAKQNYGDRRGDIVSQLVSLIPVPVRGAAKPPAEFSKA
jgi:hypothetical protein